MVSSVFAIQCFFALSPTALAARAIYSGNTTPAQWERFFADSLPRRIATRLDRAEIETALDEGLRTSSDDGPSEVIVKRINGLAGSHLCFVATMSDGCLAIIDGTGALEVIASFADPLSVTSPEVVQYHEGRMLVAGLSDWYSNVPRYSFSLYKRTTQGWKRQGFEETKNECWKASIPASLLRKGGTVTLRSSTYPKHFSTSHSGANAEYDETFRVRRGALAYVGRERVDSACNAFDDLTGALVGNDARALQHMIPDPNLRSKLTSLNLSSMPSGQEISGNVFAWQSEKWNVRFARLNQRWNVVALDAQKPTSSLHSEKLLFSSPFLLTPSNSITISARSFIGSCVFGAAPIGAIERGF